MRASTSWKTRSSAALVLLLASLPARAGYWDRIEIIGGYGGNGFVGLRLFDLGLYNARYGLGVGTRIADMRAETWDLPRESRPDSSAHALIIPVPFEARVALASWEGKPFISGTSAESSIGRLELFAAYCPWALFGSVTEVQTSLLGDRKRAALDDLVRTETWDAGLHYDSGKFWYVSAGRFEFKTRARNGYLTRRDGRWYAMAGLYYGRTHGETVGGSPLNLFRDAAFKIGRLFGRRAVIKDD